MSFSNTLIEVKEYFQNTQNALYEKFKSDNTESLKLLIDNVNNLDISESVSTQIHDSYILDYDDYAYLLIHQDGSVERLSPHYDFMLVEESIDTDNSEAMLSDMLMINDELSLARYIPANSAYDFPTIKDNETIPELHSDFVDALDEKFELFAQDITQQFELGPLNEEFESLLEYFLSKHLLVIYYTFESHGFDNFEEPIEEIHDAIWNITISKRGRLAVDSTIEKLQEILESQE